MYKTSSRNFGGARGSSRFIKRHPRCKWCQAVVEFKKVAGKWRTFNPKTEKMHTCKRYGKEIVKREDIHIKVHGG